MIRSFLVFAGVTMLLASRLCAQLQVVSTQPGLNARNVSSGAPISATFDRPVNPATFTTQNFWAFARWSGPVAGAITFSNGNQTATLTPSRPFFAGEVVMLIMSHNLRGADNSALRAGGYTLMFTVGVAPSTGHFRQLQTISDRDASGAQTRIYGGLACDLNRDGWCDMTMVNEVSADLRVFLNRHDGSGLFQPVLTPYTPIPFESSPNRPADFNRDGFFDIVTTSDGDNKITFAYGNGTGGFSSTTQITAGGNPRGIGILDINGDGWLDVAVANVAGNSIMLLTNDGAGHFPSSPPSISAPGGPYGMVAADMNNDGLLDLVVGNNSDSTICVFLNNGAGGFVRQTPRACGGPNWVLQVGDLNGDGKLDVVSANSFAANGSVMMGNGNGTLGPATTYPAAGHCPSTDLADIDGDGDLDWIVSSFAGNRWYLYRNNGAGVMTLDTVFMAPSNPACTLFADFNNDGAVDLMLLDEIADVIVIMQNIPCGADFNNDGDIGTDADIEAFFACLGGTCCTACQGADFNGDGDVGTDADIESFFRVLAGGAC
jgi:FG-GAP-like repeat/Bacterial Ig-like domain